MTHDDTLELAAGLAAVRRRLLDAEPLTHEDRAEVARLLEGVEDLLMEVCRIAEMLPPEAFK